MLLIDGVKYELWEPPSEEAFEDEVKEHVLEVFGEDCLYFDRKQRLKSLAGIGSIPDGLAIVMGDKPEWHIVEFELASHDVYGHIVAQVSKFISGLNSTSTRQRVRDALYGEITKNPAQQIIVEQALHSGEVFKFVADVVESKPVLTIVIENETDELSEAVAAFAYPNLKGVRVVEFRTFTRERVGLPVHAHLFKPVYGARPSATGSASPPTSPLTSPVTSKSRVSVKALLDSGGLRAGNRIFHRSRDTLHEAEITKDGLIRLLNNGREYSSLSRAATDITGHNVNGWRYWKAKTPDGQEHTLDQMCSRR